MSSLQRLNIVLQEDLTIRGGAQLWLMNCGTRLCAAGHNVTILLPATSLLLEDWANGPMTIETYDADAIAENPNDFEERFTLLLKKCQVCVIMVRPQRGNFQNVDFMIKCIVSGNLKSYESVMAEPGTSDPTNQKYFCGGPLFDKSTNDECFVIANTMTFIVEHMGVLAKRKITDVHNGTDTTLFQRIINSSIQGDYNVGCIGPLEYEMQKAQIVLLEAAKKLIEDGRLTNMYCCLFVGERTEGWLREKIEEYGLQQNAVLCDFTKNPFYVFGLHNFIPLPPTGMEGLPKVLLEALFMEKRCKAATSAYGMAEVVQEIDGKTGHCFPSGDVDALADAIYKIAGTSEQEQKQLALVGKELIITEHDEAAKQVEKMLEIIKQNAAKALRWMESTTLLALFYAVREK